MSEGKSLAGRPTLGRAAAWSRDLAIVGAGTAFTAGFAVNAGQVFSSLFIATAMGGLMGALFGIVIRHLLLGWLHRPIVAWIPISLVLGGVWGGSIGYVLALVTGEPRSALLLGLYGAIAGALQLCWFWLPYAVRAGRGKSTWPIVTAAVVVGGAVGWAAFYVLLAILRPQFD
jgi:hypothetical protein